MKLCDSVHHKIFPIFQAREGDIITVMVMQWFGIITMMARPCRSRLMLN
jgi:hypothetical protein